MLLRGNLVRRTNPRRPVLWPCDRAPPRARALLPATRSRASGPLGALLSSPALGVRLMTALHTKCSKCSQPMRETLYIACIARPSPRRERERAESMEVSRRDSDAALPGRPRSRYSWAAAGYMLIAVAKPASRARAEPAPRGGGERAEGAEA